MLVEHTILRCFEMRRATGFTTRLAQNRYMYRRCETICFDVLDPEQTGQARQCGAH
jgi:hypothetical protein